MKNKVVYLVKEDDEWEVYNSLEDAVDLNEDKIIYTAQPEPIGKFKFEVNLVKIKEKKKQSK